MTPPTRREVLRGLGLAAAVAGIAGCTSRPSAGPPPTVTDSSTPRSRSASPNSAEPSPTASATGSGAVLPPAEPWTTGPGEVPPAVKARATRTLELVGTWSAGESGPAAAMGRLAGAGGDAKFVKILSELLPDAEAAVMQVVNAQYGGILASSASVLVVVRQWFLTRNDLLREHGTTFDVRLVASEGRWRVTAIHPARPGPAVTRLSPVARAALANERIRFPAACEADVRSGQVHDSVLSALTSLSAHHVLDVSILRSGHPYLVFGTNRPSDHPHGRAADIWAIDGRRVVDPANRSAVIAFMREASATGPWQVGGPVDLDGPRTMFFSDPTHHDHVHMGFRT